MDILSAPIISSPIVTPNDDLSLEQLITMYKNQQRECWLCDKIVKDIEAGKDISDDNKWHLTACILSWENIHRL